jgi:flagellar biosynthesis chaperone FliJ
MARDPLRILLSMRRRSVEQARQALAGRLAAETEVADRIRLLDDATRRDREAGGAWPDSHQFLEMSASRLEVVQAERQSLAADLTAAERGAAEARGVVSTARTAAEAVEELISQREAASQADATRREQHGLDDIARTRLTVRQRRYTNPPNE